LHNYNTNGQSQIFSTNTITLNSWYHVAVIYDASSQTARFCINGNCEAPVSHSPINGGFDQPWVIGTGDPAEKFNGIIDEVRIYNRALSDVEIQALYQAKARLDYGDIRFADSDGSTQLNYWQEVDGKFWVKVPSIPASTTKTIYVYYGNPNTTSLSNPDATMFIYEDYTTPPRGSFAGSATYDTANKWVQLTPNSGNQEGYLYYAKVPTNPTGFYAKFYFWAGGGSGSDAIWLGAYDTSYVGTREDIVNGGYHFTYDEYQDRICFTKSTSDNGAGIACASETTIDNSSWHLAEIYFWYDGSRVCTKIYYDRTLKVNACDTSVQSNVINGVGQIIFGGRTGWNYNYHRIGNRLLYVAKYISPEPTISLGAEEVLSGGGSAPYIREQSSLGDVEQKQTRYGCSSADIVFYVLYLIFPAFILFALLKRRFFVRN
jgi:hypothetical protein